MRLKFVVWPGGLADACGDGDKHREHGGLDQPAPTSGARCEAWG